MKDLLDTFGYPGTLAKEYQHWHVLVGPKQITLGTLILVCKDGATALGEISDAAFAELPQVIREVEAALRRVFSNNRVNYLWLMMANPEVHAAILPRYSAERTFEGVVFRDSGWPRKPDLDFVNEVPPEVFAKLVATLRAAFV